MLVEIAKIQQRKGRKEDLPVLDVAQMGFTIDTGELFIGSDVETQRVVNRGNFPYQNIKILTEFDMVTHIVGDTYIRGPQTTIHLTADGSSLQLVTWDVTELDSFVMYYNFIEDSKSNGQMGKIFCIQNNTDTRLMIERVNLKDPANPITPAPTDNTIDNLTGNRISFKTIILSGKLSLNVTVKATGDDGSTGGDGVFSFFVYYW